MAGDPSAGVGGRFDHHAVEFLLFDHLAEASVAFPILVFTDGFEERVDSRLEGIADGGDVHFRNAQTRLRHSTAAATQPDEPDLHLFIGARSLEAKGTG